MWEVNPAAFSEKHQITLGQTRLLQCTGEHLHPKSKGGANSSENIVAACKYCNQTRHKAKTPLTADRYKQRVRSLSKAGKWYTAKIVTNTPHSTSKKAE
ncbi:HNH endonuclease signature motif containing protein [Aeromonas hydrophila]|uniref:HNH endonuclease signature motif containing protein n=1 Tax=Aeromonas hydrophila TaxID=644 RepID=UPI00356B3D34